MQGRPDREGGGGIEELGDEELEAELTVAASAPNKRRFERYLALLAEAKRRSLVPRGGADGEAGRTFA